jgi:prepilin signal peptidase PulO-like enzyme (type II secretory pathway)
VLEQLIAALCATAAFGAAWCIAGATAFRHNRDGELGRADPRACLLATVAAAGLTATRSPYLPDAALLGVLCGMLGVIVVVDLRLGVIYNALTVPLALVALGDAIVRGRVLDAAVGVFTTGLLITVAYRARLVGEGDVKAAAAIAIALGGFFGVVAVALGLIGALVFHLAGQWRARLPVVTTVAWAPLLVAGVGAVLALAATPAGALLVVSVP